MRGNNLRQVPWTTTDSNFIHYKWKGEHAMNFKKVASIALAGAMAMSMMAVPAFADGTDATTTPTPTPIPTNTGKAYDVNVQNHTYNAYQIFTGTQADKNQPLGNVDWGTGVDSTGLLNALKDKDNQISGLDFSTCASAENTAQAVANVLTTGNDGKQASDEQARAFAKIAYGYIKSDAAITLGTESTNTITIKSKAQYPTIEKKILDPDEKDVNEASMGEDVQYELKSTVPDTKAYTEGYYFYMSDMQSKGLTLDENSFVVTVGDKTLTKDTDYTVTVEHSTDPADTIDYITTDADWPTAFEINFNNIQNYTAGQAIKVTYKAELNKDAVIYPASNPNKVNLHYSNNPNVKYDGRTEGQKPTEPMGETPWDEVKTYTTGVKLQKVGEDGNTFTDALKDAEFTLTTTGGMKYSVVTTNAFTEDANGTYWKLKNGTYTTTDPASVTDPSKYESTTTKYTNATTTTVKGVGQTDTTIKATVDGAGQIRFTGLGAGEYTLTETKVPAGYNTADPVTFTIDFKADSTAENGYTFTSSDPTKVSFDSATGLFNTSIINMLGNTLPTTGGIGTRMFYVFGGCLVAAAVALLALKRRREA